MKILGISAYYHDSAAALVTDGQITAAAQEERFTRKKHDAGFPARALEYCLREGGVRLQDVDRLVFYDKPIVKFDRLLETYLSYAPSGIRSFMAAMPIWLKEKLYLKTLLKKEFAAIADCDTDGLPPLMFTEHHQAHAASAFFPSPFQQAAVLCMDGVGEWATTTVWSGDGNALTPQWEIDFPHSMGLLYSAFTYYTGFKVNSGEYKLMGLAPYGEPKFVRTILDNLVDIKDDGTFRLNMDYFNFTIGLTMTNKRFDALFDGPPRAPESTVTQREMDIARSIQVVTEEVVMRIGQTIHRELGVDNLCMAGGVALNCVANGRLLREGPFNKIWIQPAAGDAGGALGAALSVWHEYLEQPRTVNGGDSMRGAYLGPRFADDSVREQLDAVSAVYQRIDDDALPERIAEILADEKVVGWFQGRMEFGPRALGGRSIIGDPRSRSMQSVMNLKIKYRESFRPFAPSVLADKVSEWFEMDCESPYMLLVADVARSKQIEMTDSERDLFGIEKLNAPRSDIPESLTWTTRLAFRRCMKRRILATMRCFAPSGSEPDALCWSTHRSTCAESRSCAHRKTPTVASCAPRWTTSWSRTICSRSRNSQPSMMTARGATSSSSTDMATMTHEIPELDAKGLRQFALVTGAILALLFGLALPWLLSFGYPTWPWIVAGILVAWGLLAPSSLRPVYRGWMRFGLIMNRVVTPLILGIMFFLIITPVALVMKLIRRDPMQRTLDASKSSYRVASSKAPREKMERPY